MCSLGLTGVSFESKSGSLSAVPVVNLLYEVLQLQRRAQRALHELETQQLKNGSDLEHLQHSNCRLKVLRFLHLLQTKQWLGNIKEFKKFVFQA